MIGGDSIGVAATLAILGLPAMTFLTTSDRDERLLLGALAAKGVETLDRIQRNQAIHVVNALAKAIR